MNDPAQKRKMIMALAAAVIGLGVLGYMVVGSLGFGGNSPANASRKRTLIDAKTSEVFEEFFIPDGAKWPMTNPKTGAATLFPAEGCYWTKEGGAKFRPTWVLLNQYAGKPGDTICPDCGRKVVAHNPMPPPAILEKAK